METNVPEQECTSSNAAVTSHPDHGQAWTESEWFHEWLRLARGDRAEHGSDEGELHDEAA
jgi:hypothetical protein